MLPAILMVGCQLLDLRCIVALALCLGKLGSLCGDDLGSQVARQNLLEFQHPRRMKVNPLALPAHGLERGSKHRAESWFDLVRQQAAWRGVAFDRRRAQSLEVAPWQAVLPMAGGQAQTGRLRLLMGAFLSHFRGSVDE